LLQNAITAPILGFDSMSLDVLTIRWPTGLSVPGSINQFTSDLFSSLISM
jgi:hypothetical protein